MFRSQAVVFHRLGFVAERLLDVLQHLRRQQLHHSEGLDVLVQLQHTQRQGERERDRATKTDTQRDLEKERETESGPGECWKRP